jgi:RNA polymerase sigma factor (sigma-70 family)
MHRHSMARPHAMQTAPSSGVLGFIRQLAEAGGCPEAPDRELPDRELLSRYASQRSECAFAAIVRRHGPLVLRLCRRIVPNEADAEDAFQATFLVLSRKAASIRPADALASWLYGVAYRTAQKAKIAHARRLRHERQARPREAQDPYAALALAEAHDVLHRELARLPDRFRLPLVLCYLEALTGDEAARQLGWPPGTLKSRLEQAREKLRRRLRARGMALSGAAAASLFDDAKAAAAVPAALLNSTITVAAASGGAAATAAVSANVNALAQGVITTMALTRLTNIAVLLLLFLGVVGAGVFAFHGAPALGGDAKGQQRGAARSEPPATPPETPANGKRDPKPRIVEPGGFVFRMAWGADNNTIATVSLGQKKVEDGDKKTVVEFHSTVKFWDAAKGALRLSLGEESKVRIESIAFSPDGKLSALTCFTGVTGRGDAYEIRLVEPATGAFKKTIKQPDPVRAAAFSPNGKVLAVGGAILPTDLAGPFHRVVRLWDVSEAKVLKEFKQELQLKEDDPYLDGLRDLAFSPDGKLLATADADSKVRLTDVQTGKVLHTLEGHANVAFTLAFAPDGKTLVSGSYDETARVWDVPTGKHLRTLGDNKGAVNAVAFSPDGKLLATGASAATLWDTASWEAKKTLPGKKGPVTRIAFAPGRGQSLAIATSGQVMLWRLDDILASE